MFRKKCLAFISLLSLSLFVSPLTVRANFDFNANCLKAYQNIFELKLNNAKQIIAVEKKNNPQNSIIPLLENYIDYFTLLTSESKTEFDKLKENKSKRLNQISNDNKKSPYYLYAQAEINLQWALIRGRYGEYFNAGLEIKRALSQLTENNEKFPGFHLNLKGLGLINTVLGSLPDGALKSSLSALGIRGNVGAGLAMLDKLAENLPKSSYEPFYEETVFNYAYVLSDVVHSPSAYAKTMKLTARISDSSLLKFYLQAYVSARNEHNDEALAILAERPTGPAYQAFPYLDYLTGICKLNKLDTNAAFYFNTFLKTNKGVNLVKDTYLHLGWVALFNGNTPSYSENMSRVKSAGYTYHERDKQAVNEANAPVPDLTLLKARLLFDGGYYRKSLDILTSAKEQDFNSEKDKTEYHYRLGRINKELGKYDQSLLDFQQSFAKGKSMKYYFAANSVLQMGLIYEQKKNYTAAKSLFNTAINMKGHEYETSIETQSKQALKRISK